jgi:cytoskeletal protein CcmA (bactofilin family)
MAIFDQKTAARKEATPFSPDPAPFREPPVPSAVPDAAPAPRQQSAAKESLIAADLAIEGKIEGTGNVRIAGKFKGDVNVQGDLTIEQGAKLTGGVRARRVVIAGELEGNIEAAQLVELQQGGVLVGDVKAGSLTVATGARMRGQADFGWEDKPSANGIGGKPNVESRPVA